MRNVGKKFLKSIVVAMLAIAIMLGFVSVTRADETITRGIVKKEVANNHSFNTKDILMWSANLGANIPNLEWPFIYTSINQDGIDSGEFVELNLNEAADNGEFYSDDAACFYQMGQSGIDAYKIGQQLAQKFNIDAKDVEVEITVAMPKINESFKWNIKNGTLQQSEEDAKSYIDRMYEYDKDCYKSGEYSFYGWNENETTWEQDYDAKIALLLGHFPEDGEEIPQNVIDKAKEDIIQERDCTVISARAILPDGTAYRLIVGGNDKWKHNVLLQKEEDSKLGLITEISYMAFESNGQANEGKMDGATFLPPYYDNDNAKKDMDAVATIKSKTDEGIVKTDGVDLNKDGTPNSLGWYYPDTTNTKVIAKKYLFDTYDNITANGMVNETVKLTGEDGGEDTQNPAKKWTFRRTKKEEATNSDESITITITYNLPIDTTKIPDGWEAVYDEGSTTTAHKIRKTIKKGENYEKDVIVKQNGTDATVTTHVAKVWPIPQAGESIAFIIAIGIIAFVVITRARKHHSLKDIK